jgi:hypothetical protein
MGLGKLCLLQDSISRPVTLFISYPAEAERGGGWDRLWCVHDKFVMKLFSVQILIFSWIALWDMLAKVCDNS